MHAQTYSVYVGDEYRLPEPTAPAGYVDHVGMGRCTNKSDCIGVSGLLIKVNKYFTGTATIEVDYTYYYTDKNNKRHVGDGTAYYSVTCKATKLTLNETELLMDVGDEVDLTYQTQPSGMEPYVNWKTSNKEVAGFEYWGVTESMEWEKTVTVLAVAEGTCTITLQSNTGYPAPTCKVTVADFKWVKTDVPSGDVKKGTKVTLTSSKAGAAIYYTTDGSEPSKQSNRYTLPIVVNEDMTLKAKAYLGSEESKTTVREYTVVAHAVADTFTYTTKEGVNLKMMAYQYSSSIRLQVGTGQKGDPAIDKNYTGHVIIPRSVDGMLVNSISEYAFDGCKFSSIDLPSSIYVESYAFRDCNNLVGISFPTYIRLLPWSFANCSSLRSISFDGQYYFPTTIPGSSRDANNVFAGCDAIRRIYLYTSASTIKDDVFPSSVYTNATLFVPEDYVSKYNSTSGWKNFTNIESTKAALEKQVQLSTSLRGTFGVVSGTKVLLSSTNVEDADIYYTLNGTNPSKSSIKYSSAGITITSNSILKAIAYKSGYDDSNILISGNYNIRKSNTPLYQSVKQMSADMYHTMLVMTDGSLWACGSNNYGQLGNGSTSSSASLIKIMDGVKSVSVGNSFSLIVKMDGTLWACGRNYYGQLGDGTTIDRTTPVKIMDGVASVSAGSKHSLIVKTDGTLWSCGDDYYGQLGDGRSGYADENYNDLISATPIKITDGIAAVATGSNHSLALKTDGTLWACGGNGDGQLGDGSTTKRVRLVKVMDNVSSVSAGGSYTLIIKADRTLWACGYNGQGQLGDGTTTKRITPIKVMDDVASISAGDYHSLIVKTDRTLWACGNNGYGQLGDGTTYQRSTPVKVMDDVVSVSAGGYHSFIAATDGSVWSSGENTDGRLGDGTTDNCASPIKIVGDSPAEAKLLLSASPSGGEVTAGTKVYLSTTNATGADIYYTLNGSTPSKNSTKYTSAGITISSDCTLKAIAYKDGYADSDVLTVSYTVKNEEEQTKEQLDISVKQLAAGDYTSFFVNNDGTLYAWGNNSWGQLGDGSTENRSIPTKIMGNVSFVNTKTYRTIFIDNNGTLMACGSSPLGNGNTHDSSVPIRIMDNVSYAETGNHSLILKRDGTLWAFGSNTYGEMGYEEEEILFAPEQIMSDVKTVAVGSSFSLVVKNDGTLWTFGSNDCGQLGDGTTTNRYIPLKIMDNVSSVSAGNLHSLILKNDGTLWGCGLNDKGMLGDGSSTNRLQPVKITENVVAMAAGAYHSLVVKQDGTLWACGYNESGGLGDGTTKERHELVKIMENVKNVSAGFDHSLVVKRDGSLWAFGGNHIGQLGDGTTIDRYSPVMIMEGNKPISENKEITTSSSGYATFYSSESAYTLPNGLSAQVVTGVSNGKLTYKTIADGSVNGVVPKGTAVMLVSDNLRAGSYTLTPSNATTAYSGTNLLRGSDETTTTTGSGRHYKLAYGPSGTGWRDVFGWYWGAQNGAPFQIEGHKAWLVVPRGSGTRAAGFSIDGEALGISQIEDVTLNIDDCYDLQGCRVSQPTTKGIYIRNGKKIVNR